MKELENKEQQMKNMSTAKERIYIYCNCHPKFDRRYMRMNAIFSAAPKRNSVNDQSQ
jgi:hypothetical protein